MKRHKKIVILAHCILNQNAVVYPLARAKGAFNDIIADYLKDGYGLYQLPCPELKYMGLSRKPMTKEDYDTAAYRQVCRKLTHEVICDLKHYIDDGVHIECVYGIQESPTCAISGNRGHFMTTLVPAIEHLLGHQSYKEVASTYETDS